MTNNTTRAFTVNKANVAPDTAHGAGAGAIGATLQPHYEWFGTFVCNGATPVTVTEPNVAANCSIVITLKTVGGTVSPSVPYIATITAGTGFTVTGTASDTSTYSYHVTNFAN